MKLNELFRRFAPCSCMRIQPIDENARVDETVKISIKTTCCRRTKIININITPDNIDTLKDVKDIIHKIEMNAQSTVLQNENKL